MKDYLCCFLDVKKAFDRIPCKVILWSLRKLGVDERIMRLAKVM